MDLRTAHTAAALAASVDRRAALRDELLAAGSAAAWVASRGPLRPLPRRPPASTLALDWADPAYPVALRDLDSPPPALFVRGIPRPLPPASQCVALIGSRRCTERSRWLAYDLARGVAQAGVTVVSGLALGIDAAAHEGALAGGGTTVAVIASPVDRPTPQRNARLGERIAESGGWLVSERALDAQVAARDFPWRNRLVAGLVQAVVVVEAGLPSGTLSTVARALDLDPPRDVGAVPGPPGAPASQGANALIKAGAALVESPQDVLELLGRFDDEPANPADPDEQQLLSGLREAAGGPGDWVRASGLPAPRARAALGRLLARGSLRRLDGGRIARVTG